MYWKVRAVRTEGLSPGYFISKFDTINLKRVYHRYDGFISLSNTSNECLTSERYTFVHDLIFDISGKTHINWQPSPTHMILLFVSNFSVNILLQETIYLDYF